MPNTTPAFAALPSFDPALLLLVSGGCHKRCPPPAPPAPPAPVLQQQIMQPILPPAAAPAAAPAADPSTVVTTNVSINGKPVA